MSLIKSEKEIEILRAGGKRLAQILKKVSKEVKEGASTKELNDMAERLARESGGEPAFLGYRPEGASRPFPAGLCVSVDEEIVHGIPNESGRVLKKGDMVTLDMGLIYGGLFTDSATTVGIGRLDREGRKLMKVTKKALEIALKKAKPGNRVGEIGFSIEEYVKSKGFVPAEDLGGHGVGHKVHEEPFVPNFGPKDSGIELQAGMVLAIEPIINEGTSEIYLANDGYTYKTKDGKRSAQYEHTILITSGKPEILTKI